MSFSCFIFGTRKKGWAKSLKLNEYTLPSPLVLLIEKENL